MLLEGSGKVFASILISFSQAPAVVFLCVLGGFARDKSF
jgi:hypothetical protein